MNSIWTTLKKVLLQNMRKFWEIIVKAYKIWKILKNYLKVSEILKEILKNFGEILKRFHQIWEYY